MTKWLAPLFRGSTVLCYRLSIVTLRTRFPGQMESLDGCRKQCRICAHGILYQRSHFAASHFVLCREAVLWFNPMAESNWSIVRRVSLSSSQRVLYLYQRCMHNSWFPFKRTSSNEYFMSPYLAVQTNVNIQRLLIMRRQRDVVLGNVHELL